MEKEAPGNQLTSSLPCGCEVHLRQRRRSSRRASTTMTDLQRRLLAGKAGLLELALLRETQRRLIEETVRQHRRLESSSNEEQRFNSKHLRSQSTVSDSTDENRSWSGDEESDEVFESNFPEASETRIDRTNVIESLTETTRLRCLSELHCRSRTSNTSSPHRTKSETRRCRQRCRSEGTPNYSSDFGRTVQMSEAYMRPLVFSSGLTYDFPSPLHAVLTQFELTRTGPSTTFLGTLELAFDEPKSPKRLNSKQGFFSNDEKNVSIKNECVRTRPKQVCRQSRVVDSETEEAQVSELEGNFKENLNFSSSKEDEQPKDIRSHDQLLIEKMATPEQFSEFSRSSCHRLTSESKSDNNNNNKKLSSESSEDRAMGITEDDPPQKTYLSGLLREEGYFSSNDSLASIAPEPPARKRRRAGLKATKPLRSETSFSDSLASDSCEDNNTPRENEKVDRETKTRTPLLSDFGADDRAPIFC